MPVRKPLFKARRIVPGAGGRKPAGNGVGKIRRTYSDVDWDALRIKVLERDNYTCRRCGGSLRGTNRRHIHHIRELSKGGANILSNLIALCYNCHNAQHKHHI